ncbi:hypothetical protein GCM10023190_02960 [Enteractinococcus fodinae]|uniref:PH domain-containing protein n=1 Tax=Enteractinococcus fodinae TaxID=684663 RepID=A0ABU2B0U8_9MICC|nr:ABC transporter permease [Enteractinococcus fodinae]MDR7347226.1 hypothetical protein [Enteractinococcus fodinae]
MDETTFTVTLTAILVACILLGIYFGRRNRTKRQHHIAAPTEVPARLLEREPTAAVDGTYITTVLGQHLLERVTAHRLGNRSQARIEVHPEGVVLLRVGEPNFFIPAPQITQVATVSGIAGKFVEKDGILAITWNLDDTEVTTGLRTETISEHQELRTTLETFTNGRQTA